ncbi:MAG TPA: hypothetical protein VFN56_02090 [Candidatus Saccharimonadales bacterium]|nr:hypothetical protein [Candidatus Saccharimonadales bacterium]
MHTAVIFGTVSTGLAIYSGYPYIKSVLDGKTRPHRLGWLVFTIMNGMVFFAQYFAGGRESTLISLAFFVYSLVIFILSFSKGDSKTSPADWYLFTFALVAMVTWAITKSNDIAIWLTVFIDLAATTMIILKVRVKPDSEAPYPWLIGTIAYIFSCLTLYHVPVSILYVRPVYGLVCDAAIVGFIYYYRSLHSRRKFGNEQKVSG